jgi:hypothetical protein
MGGETERRKKRKEGRIHRESKGRRKRKEATGARKQTEGVWGTAGEVKRTNL